MRQGNIRGFVRRSCHRGCCCGITAIFFLFFFFFRVMQQCYTGTRVPQNKGGIQQKSSSAISRFYWLLKCFACHSRNTERVSVSQICISERERLASWRFASDNCFCVNLWRVKTSPSCGFRPVEQKLRLPNLASALIADRAAASPCPGSLTLACSFSSDLATQTRRDARLWVSSAGKSQLQH